MRIARAKTLSAGLAAAVMWIAQDGLAADPPPLIQIAVEVVEVDEQKTRRLGIRWLDQLHVEEAGIPALFEAGALTRGRIFADLHFMMEQGTADLLANPKLVTREGTTATFHAGGELPYAVAGTLGAATIEFKPYGVELKISPRLEESGRIALSVNAEVSGPDEQNSVHLAGNSVPGIRSRSVHSQLTLESGSTLTMAGMIQNQKETTRRGIPGLMDIPLLGYLFSHKTQLNRRTSIVVFVTPTVLGGPPNRPVGLSPAPSWKPPVLEEPSPLDQSVFDLEKEDGFRGDSRS